MATLDRRQKRALAKKHVDRRLLIRLRLFAVIILLIASVVLYDVLVGQIAPGLAALGLGIGTAVGFVAGRMFKILWHDEAQKVVSRLDKIGVIILLLYIAVEVGRKAFFGHWLAGAQLNAFSLAFLGGALLGRLLVMARGIRKVLVENEKLESR